MSELSTLEDWADGLIAALSSQARRTLAREIAKSLRESQAKRIAAQLNPDGTGFEPRKARLRSKKGRVRRTMFAKLRTAKYLKAEASETSAIVAFIGQAERVARVHQFGLRDRVGPRGAPPEAKYPVRELLGITAEEKDAISDLVLSHLSR